MRARTLTYRFGMAILFVAVFLYALLAIIPFYAYGLDRQPAGVFGGMFDPKGLPLYNSDFGSLLLVSAFLAMLSFPLIYASFGSLSFLILIRQWRSMTNPGRRAGIALLCLSTALFIFEFSPPGHLIWQWLLD